MHSGQRILLVLEQLLVEFLSGTQPHVLYLNILAKLQAGEGYHLLGQVVYLHGLAHVEDKDIVALSHCCGLQNQRAGLGDGHEIPDDTWIRDGHGAALGYLLLEERYDGAVGAEHVAETGGDELGLAGHPAGGYLLAYGLYVDLGYALGSSHDVGRVDGLVGGDHHEFLDVVADGGIHDVFGAEDVGLHGLHWVGLHKGHMLVGSGVEDHVGTVLIEEGVYAVLVADVGDDELLLHAGCLGAELELHVVHRRLGEVHQYQFADRHVDQLAAELPAY